jgi:hypothetical protein
MKNAPRAADEQDAVLAQVRARGPVDGHRHRRADYVEAMYADTALAPTVAARAWR